MLSPIYTHAVLEPVVHGWTIRVLPALLSYHDREHPSLGVNDCERPPSDFPPALNLWVEAKIRAGSFSALKHACSSLGCRDCGTNGTRRLTTATECAKTVFAFEFGCRRIAAGCHRIWGRPVSARHVYSRFKDVCLAVKARWQTVVARQLVTVRRSWSGHVVFLKTVWHRLWFSLFVRD